MCQISPSLSVFAPLFSATAPIVTDIQSGSGQTEETEAEKEQKILKTHLKVVPLQRIHQEGVVKVKVLLSNRTQLQLIAKKCKNI